MIKTGRSLIEGPIFFKITMFALPIMLTGVLQVLYNMADNIIVGQFSGDPDALAALGPTGSLTNLILNLLFGISVGTGVVVAQSFGADRREEVSRAVHTSLAFSVIGGIIFMIIGLLVARPALELMGTKPELLDKSHLYVSIICMGIPATSTYNFGASILRSVGDSKTPLFILAASGLANVGLNLVFVIVFNMSIAGVALATIISQYLSVVAVILILMRRKGECYAFSFKNLRIDFRLLARILRFGIPAGLQSAMFSISNVLLASGVNSLDKTTITANTIASNIDGITYIAINSFQHASMTFTGQNYGAMKYRRIYRVFAFCMIQAIICGLLVGNAEILFGEQLAGLYVDASDPNRGVIISTTLEIMTFILRIYFLCGVMEVLSGALRGLGYSIAPMLISIFGICFVRIFWVFAIFPMEEFNSIIGIYTVYPVSWIITIIMLSITAGIACYRLEKTLKATENLVN